MEWAEKKTSTVKKLENWIFIFTHSLFSLRYLAHNHQQMNAGVRGSALCRFYVASHGDDIIYHSSQSTSVARDGERREM